MPLTLPYSLSLGFEETATGRIHEAVEALGLSTNRYKENIIPFHINLAENLNHEQFEAIMKAIRPVVFNRDIHCNGILVLSNQSYMVMARWREIGILNEMRNIARLSLGSRLEPNELTNGYKWIAKTTLAISEDDNITLSRNKLINAQNLLATLETNKILKVNYNAQTLKSKIVQEYMLISKRL